MAQVNVVTNTNLGLEFDIGTIEANKIRLKTDLSITRAGDGTLSVDVNSLQIVSGDAGNLLAVGGDGGAVFNQAALQAAETVWGGTAPGGFMAVAPAGVNGHAPTFTFDFTNPAFCEGVQDCVGQAILAGAGIAYDDVANSISTALANLTFGDGLTFNAGTNTVSVLPDPTSPLAVAVSPAGVSVGAAVSSDAGNLATLGTDGRTNVAPGAVRALLDVQVCDAFDVDLFYGASTNT